MGFTWFNYLFFFLLSCASAGSASLPDQTNTRVALASKKKPVPKNAAVSQVYITLPDVVTSRAVTINYHAHPNANVTRIVYDLISRKGDKSLYQWNATGRQQNLEGFSYSVHSVDLVNLTPGTAYYFMVGDDVHGWSEEHKFKTLPQDSAEIRILQGGDMNIADDFVTLAQPLLSQKPHVYLIGGDIAYGNGWTGSGWRWRTWFDNFKRIAQDSDGFLIPMVLAVGNHEVNSGSGAPEVRAPFYFGLFPQNGSIPYFVREFGNHTVLFVLDSGHVEKHGGNQAKWLESMLRQYEKWPNKLAMYHVPLYPSHRSYSEFLSEEGRKFWLPLFDKYQLTLGMENHDHTLKRTYQLKGGKKVTSGGTFYIGDGCWGHTVRSADSRWYLEVSKSEKHLWYLKANSSALFAQAYGNDGRILDELTIPPVNIRQPDLFEPEPRITGE